MNKALLLRLGVIVALLTHGFTVGAFAGEVKIVPQPKQVVFETAAPLALANGAVGIVIGKKATNPEQYAAETLQKSAKKITGQTWPIMREGDDLSKLKVVVLIGQINTNSMLSDLCKSKSIELSEKSLGFDGYAISFAKRGSQDVVIVGGCNARGTIFGQDTLSQLISTKGGKATLTKASIRDWPSVPWRGKPQTRVSTHLLPGMIDQYALARFNYTDMRDGIYAYMPEEKLPADEIKKALKETHKIGMIAYGCVACSVQRSRHDAVIAMFKQFIELGVDGLWASFDDLGPGEAPEELLAKIIELGKKHGMTGNLIALTPPKGSYQVALGPFNQQILKIPEMQDAIWFFTSIPSKDDLAAIRTLGLKTKLGWWHNWPKMSGNVTLSDRAMSYGILYGSMGRKGGPCYVPVPKLAYGWHEPSYRSLSDAGETTEAIMQWGGSVWKPEYTYPILGWWGWAPENHDWEGDRSRIYSRLFGESKVAAAREFDNLYDQLIHLFRFTTVGGEAPGNVPLRLIDQRSKPEARRITAEMEAAFKKLETVKPEDTWIDYKRLRTFFVDSMRADVVTAKAATELQFPEYWWDKHQRALLNAIYDGDNAKASRLIADVKPRVIKEINEARNALTEMNGLDEYVKTWTDRASLEISGWKKLIEDRAASHKTCLADYEYRKTGDFGKVMLPNLNTPPQSLKLVGIVSPGNRQLFSGLWTGGAYEKDGAKVYVFINPLKKIGPVGDYAEVEITVPYSAQPGWKGIQFFLNTYANEEIAYEKVPGRWMGRSFIEIKYKDQFLWEGDLGLPRGGGEWVTVALPDVPEKQTELTLTMCVKNRRPSFNFGALAFVGPIRAVIAPR